MFGAERDRREQLSRLDLGVLGDAQRPEGIRVRGGLFFDELLGAPAIASNPMKLEGSGLRIERCKLCLVEGELDDPAAPEPDVDPKQLIQLFRQHGVKLTASPTELKRQGILERLHRGSENSGGRRRSFGSRNASLEHQDTGPIFGEPIGHAAAHQTATDYDHIGTHSAKLLGPGVAASA